MADKIKIELNHAGDEQLLKQESVADIQRRTAAIAAAARTFDFIAASYCSSREMSPAV